MSRIYLIEIVRSGDWWAISVPELVGCHTQVRRLDQVNDAAEEAISLYLDTTDEFGIQWSLRYEDDLQALAIKYDAAKSSRELAEDKYHTSRREFVEALKDAGYPNRDVGELVGLSHQRIAQLLTEH